MAFIYSTQQLSEQWSTLFIIIHGNITYINSLLEDLYSKALQHSKYHKWNVYLWPNRFPALDFYELAFLIHTVGNDRHFVNCFNQHDNQITNFHHKYIVWTLFLWLLQHLQKMIRLHNLDTSEGSSPENQPKNRDQGILPPSKPKGMTPCLEQAFNLQFTLSIPNRVQMKITFFI